MVLRFSTTRPYNACRKTQRVCQTKVRRTATIRRSTMSWSQPNSMTSLCREPWFTLGLSTRRSNYERSRDLRSNILRDRTHFRFSTRFAHSLNSLAAVRHYRLFAPRFPRCPQGDLTIPLKSSHLPQAQVRRTGPPGPDNQ